MTHSPAKHALLTALVLMAATSLTNTDAAAAPTERATANPDGSESSRRTRPSGLTPRLSGPAKALYRELRSADVPMGQPHARSLASVAARVARILVSPATYVASDKDLKLPPGLVRKHLAEALAAYFGAGLARRAPKKAEGETTRQKGPTESEAKGVMRLSVCLAFDQVRLSWDKDKTTDVDFRGILSKEAVPRTTAGTEATADALELVAADALELVAQALYETYW